MIIDLYHAPHHHCNLRCVSCQLRQESIWGITYPFLLWFSYSLNLLNNNTASYLLGLFASQDQFSIQTFPIIISLHLVFKDRLRLRSDEFVQQITILTITRSIIIAFTFSWITPHLMLQSFQTWTCLKVRTLMVMPITFRAIPTCASGDIYVWSSLQTFEPHDVAQ